MSEKTLEQRIADLEADLIRLRKAAAQRFRRLDAAVDDALRVAREAQSSAADAECKADEALVDAQDAADAANERSASR
jgi:hypothetical protein